MSVVLVAPLINFLLVIPMAGVFVTPVVDPFVLRVEVLPVAPTMMSLVVQALTVLPTTTESMVPGLFVVRHHIS